MPRESETDVTHVCRIAITEFQVLGPVSALAPAHEGFFKLKTVDLRIVADGLGVSVPMPGSVVGRKDDLSFFSIICKTVSDRGLTFVGLDTGQGVDWYCVDLKGPFFLYQ